METEIMENKVIGIIMYIKSVGKKKPSIDRIKTHLLKIGDENVWSIENLQNLLQDMCGKGLIELIYDFYKMKQTKELKLVEETLAELTIQCPSFSESETLVFQKPKNPQNYCFYKQT